MRTGADLVLEGFSELQLNHVYVVRRRQPLANKELKLLVSSSPLTTRGAYTHQKSRRPLVTLLEAEGEATREGD